jgi:riboflavin kinase/FMN adenylyltransferase
VVVGEDFHFGHGRKGNVALLTEMGAVAGFEVDGVALASAGVEEGDGSPAVSSTRVRTLVSGGDVEAAAILLGRPHQVRGPVVTGDQRGGAELGYPTANLSVPGEICLPAPGIYAGWYERPDDSRLMAAVSVGRRPTFYGADGELLVEAYLLDFAGDLYGELARLSFVHRLRDELAFDSVEALMAQMAIDVEHTRELLTRS